ncbi:MAG TPA: RagB/SusD family nutrient uptake outer membrane protein, partial [Saprospiraceae bacterium]
YRDIVQLTLMDDYTNTGLHYEAWRYYYRIIRSANTVIDGLGGQDAVPTLDENKYVMGQAKAMRAHSYFYLTQLFAIQYEADKEILPIYTNTQQKNQPKSKASDVYALMVKDLEDAITLMNGYVRPSKTEVDANIAKVILAYVLASRNEGTDMATAKTLTNEVITAGGYTLCSVNDLIGDPLNFAGTGGFNNIATPSWMWGADLTSDQGLDLVSWWGQMDYYTYSYQWAGDRKVIDNGLFASIPAADVRKSQFDTSDPNVPGTLMPYRKFYDPARTAGGQRFILTDYLYMRIEEVYLLCADAAARSGDEALARTRLKEMLANRIPDTSYIDGLSGDALKNEIYLQTRIELWGEGKAYLAMKRNKYNVQRGSNWAFSPGITINYDDTRLTFSVPQSEIQNNAFIEEGNK